MNVNVNLKKTIIVVALILIVCGGIWWYMDTAPKRKAKAEIKMMIDFVQRQALEIAIIEQSSKLADYKKQLADLKKAKAEKPLIPVLKEPVVDEVKDE